MKTFNINTIRYVLFLSILILVTRSLSAQPIIIGVPDTLDYGCIVQHSDPIRTFTVTNTGNEPLLIENVKSSTGAIVPSWPKEAINAGDSAEVVIRYATNRLGAFSKHITLTTNIVNSPFEIIRVIIKGEVKLSTSIDELINRKVNLYPTVATEYLNLEIVDNLQLSYDYKILNFSGQTLQSGKWSQGQRINISNLISGHYILHFNSDGIGRVSKRFIKH